MMLRGHLPPRQRDAPAVEIAELHDFARMTVSIEDGERRIASRQRPIQRLVVGRVELANRRFGREAAVLEALDDLRQSGASR